MQPVADTSLACTLSPEALPQRLNWIQRVTSAYLKSHQLKDSTLRLTYRPQAKTDLVKIVAAEERCCAFLRFSLHDMEDGGIELEIHAPQGPTEEVRWLFAQFLPAAPQVVTTKSCGCAPGRCG